MSFYFACLLGVLTLKRFSEFILLSFPLIGVLWHAFLAYFFSLLGVQDIFFYRNIILYRKIVTIVHTS